MGQQPHTARFPPPIIPAGAIIEPIGYLVLHRSDNGVALNNDGDPVRFLGPDGWLLDSVPAPVHGGSTAGTPTRTASQGQARIMQALYARAGRHYVLDGCEACNDSRLDTVKLRWSWLDGPSGAQVGGVSKAEASELSPAWRLLSAGPVATAPGGAVARVEVAITVSSADPGNPAHATFDDLSLRESPARSNAITWH